MNREKIIKWFIKNPCWALSYTDEFGITQYSYKKKDKKQRAETLNDLEFVFRDPKYHNDPIDLITCKIQMHCMEVDFILDCCSIKKIVDFRDIEKSYQVSYADNDRVDRVEWFNLYFDGITLY